MGVEQPHLRDGRSAYEAGVLVKLRAGFHATATRNAARERIGDFLIFRVQARPRPKIIGAVDRYPGLNGLEILKDHATIGGQIADDRELRKWLQPNRLFEIVN